MEGKKKRGKKDKGKAPATPATAGAAAIVGAMLVFEDDANDDGPREITVGVGGEGGAESYLNVGRSDEATSPRGRRGATKSPNSTRRRISGPVGKIFQVQFHIIYIQKWAMF